MNPVITQKQAIRVFEKARLTLDERDKTQSSLSKAIEDTSTALQTAQAALSVAKQQLAEAETDAALTGATVPSNMLKAVHAARDQVDSLEARMTGLRARQVADAEDLDRLLNESEQAFVALSGQAIEDIQVEFVRATDQFMNACRKLIGTGRGFGFDLAGIRAIRIPDRAVGSASCFEVMPTICDEHGRHVDYNNPVISKASEAASSHKLELERLRQACADLRKRREAGTV